METVSFKDKFGITFTFQSFQPSVDGGEGEILDRPEVGQSVEEVQHPPSQWDADPPGSKEDGAIVGPLHGGQDCALQLRCA